MDTEYAKTPETKRIAFLMDLSLHGARHFLTDFAAWGREHARWRIFIQEGRRKEQTLDPIALHADAAVVSGSYIDILPQLKRHRIPFIVTDPMPREWRRTTSLRNTPIVKLDSRAVGIMAAEYFLERRYTSFAFVAETGDNDWSEERRSGFVDRLAKEGLSCAVYKGFSQQEELAWSVERPRLMAWLSALPKPTAILAAMDGRARLVLDACVEAGITVPNEIAVLGVDDDPVLCETAYPRLSSVRVGENGQQTARAIDRLLGGLPVEPVVEGGGPFMVIERESTGHNALSNPVIARGLFHIRDHAGTENLTVPDVVARMGCSRRTAETLFSEHVGHSIKSEISRVRYSEVKRLLSETNLSIAAIAERCAFPSESQLSRGFSALFGTTMTDYRERH